MAFRFALFSLLVFLIGFTAAGQAAYSSANNTLLPDITPITPPVKPAVPAKPAITKPEARKTDSAKQPVGQEEETGPCAAYANYPQYHAICLQRMAQIQRMLDARTQREKEATPPPPRVVTPPRARTPVPSTSVPAPPAAPVEDQ